MNGFITKAKTAAVQAREVLQRNTAFAYALCLTLFLGSLASAAGLDATSDTVLAIDAGRDTISTISATMVTKGIEIVLSVVTLAAAVMVVAFGINAMKSYLRAR